MANRRGRPFVRAVRRGSFWEGVNIDISVTTGASVVIAAITEANLESVPNPTIVRVRGNLLCRVSATGAASAAASLTMGLIVMDARSFAVPSVEIPNTDVGSDWFWWDQRSFTKDTTTGQADDDSGESLVTRIHVDNKAMRKVQVNQVVALVAQNLVQNGTMTIDLSGTFRMLLKK